MTKFKSDDLFAPVSFGGGGGGGGGGDGGGSFTPRTQSVTQASARRSGGQYTHGNSPSKDWVNNTSRGGVKSDTTSGLGGGVGGLPSNRQYDSVLDGKPRAE